MAQAKPGGPTRSAGPPWPREAIGAHTGGAMAPFGLQWAQWGPVARPWAFGSLDGLGGLDGLDG